MISAIISGLVGSIIIILLISYFKNNPSQSDVSNKLSMGKGALFIAVLCFSMTAFLIWVIFDDHDIMDKPTDLVIALTLTSITSGLGFYFLIDFLFVKLSFNEEKIIFESPWRKKIEERWENIESVYFNDNYYWHVIIFKSQKKIRISIFLSGRLNFLEQLKNIGFNF
ncbi:MAG: hypothetical protein OQK51_01175 [Kangiellaceae bacterium]|nr:hypothetical protein [Kangiellaceae bacterium]